MREARPASLSRTPRGAMAYPLYAEAVVRTCHAVRAAGFT